MKLSDFTGPRSPVNRVSGESRTRRDLCGGVEFVVSDDFSSEHYFRVVIAQIFLDPMPSPTGFAGAGGALAHFHPTEAGE